MSNSKFLIISAAAFALLDEIYSCLAPLALDAPDNKLPDSIQFFPPGRHSINASKGGQPCALTVDITAQTAEYLAKDLNDMLAAASRGEGPKPYIDFNHNDQEASGWVQSIYWAGEDKATGGVRAKIDWTAPGGQAIQGKSYRQFSPNFRVSPDTGEIIGSTVNMGGLVNRPAFKRISPLFAKDAGDNQEQKVNTMNKLHAALVAAGLLSAIPTDEATAVIEFSARWNPISAKLTEGDVAARTVTVQTKTISDLTTDRDIFKAKSEKMADANAKTIVAGWVKDGIIAPKDEEGQKRWTTILAKDPDAVSLMEPVIQARAAQGVKGGGGDVTRTIIVNGKPTEQTIVAKETGQDAFTIKAKEIEVARKLKPQDAVVAAAMENPALYDEYRKGLLFVDAPQRAPGATA